ncbi:MAG: DUF2809 domain-containing protein [Bacteroidota bacterium]|nr:DUF2809 domain-containing protein [Bacteroidota bacterium]
MNRITKRLLYLIILIIIILLGLYSGKLTGKITEIIDLKDVLWAMMVYFIFRIVFIDWPIRKVAVSGLIFSIVIEVSQLYHEDWIDRLRSTFLGGIILGTGFVWGDLLAYSIGIVVCILIDYFISNFMKNQRGRN